MHVNHVWISEKDPLSQFKKLEMEIFVFPRQRLDPRALPWQQHSRCHSVLLVMCISIDKFEDHYSNISRDILDAVFCCSSGAIYDTITFLIGMINKKTWISLKWKKIFQIIREIPFFFTLKIISNKQQLFCTAWAL